MPLTTKIEPAATAARAMTTCRRCERARAEGAADFVSAPIPLSVITATIFCGTTECCQWCVPQEWPRLKNWRQGEARTGTSPFSALFWSHRAGHPLEASGHDQLCPALRPRTLRIAEQISTPWPRPTRLWATSGGRWLLAGASPRTLAVEAGALLMYPGWTLT